MATDSDNWLSVLGHKLPSDIRLAEQAIQVSVPLFILQSVINLGLTIWVIRAILIHIPEFIQTDKIFMFSLEVILIILVILIIFCATWG